MKQTFDIYNLDSELYAISVNGHNTFDGIYLTGFEPTVMYRFIVINVSLFTWPEIQNFEYNDIRIWLKIFFKDILCHREAWLPNLDETYRLVENKTIEFDTRKIFCYSDAWDPPLKRIDI